MGPQTLVELAEAVAATSASGAATAIVVPWMATAMPKPLLLSVVALSVGFRTCSWVHTVPLRR